MKSRTLVAPIVVVLLIAVGMNVLAGAAVASAREPKPFRAGAYAMDITPTWFPIVVNGHFQPRYAEKAEDPLHARCVVLDDGAEQVAIVVVDSCVIGRELMDEAKRLAHEATGIPTDRMFLSATHTHSAPASIGALNTDPDEKYVAFLPGRIAEGIRRAQANLAPARVGWGIGQLPELAMSRRWIIRPDKIRDDPFGEPTVRATMHPGYRNPDWEDESGPMDPAVSVLALKSHDGKPLALLAAYSIHYVGAPILSADYFGAFANRMAELVGPSDAERPFVGILANGTSGDAYIRDYSRKTGRKFDRFQVADAVANVAFEVYRSMEFHDRAPLAMGECKLELGVRKPKLDWAKKVLAEAEGRPPKTSSEVYAREHMLLSQMPPTRELKLQALRIGGLGIVGIPAEVFAITGLKVRERSPIQPTFTISLANGWDGYLPPPEQLSMGGYTTWLARSSCLEAEAEPKIVATLMGLLDEVAGDARTPPAVPSPGPYAAAVLAAKPAVYWRLGELNGPDALDAASGKPRGTFETRIAYGMPGPRADAFPGFEPANRAPHFVGERMKASVDDLGDAYTVELWLYNSMPTDARPVTGYFLSIGPVDATGAAGDHLAIGGTDAASGKLLFHQGDRLDDALTGTTDVALRNWVTRDSWHHVALVRGADQVAVYLDGNPQPELSGQAKPSIPRGPRAVFLGGRPDNVANFEGRIDEVAIYPRALSADQIAAHYRAAKNCP